MRRFSKTYLDYIRSPQWDAKRRLALQKARYRCQKCGTSNIRLHVHHRHYRRLGHEDLRDLIVLCEACHENAHTAKPKNGRPLTKKQRFDHLARWNPLQLPHKEYQRRFQKWRVAKLQEFSELRQNPCKTSLNHDDAKTKISA